MLSGKSVVRQVENLPTQAGDKPQPEAAIADCGELSADEVIAAPIKAPDALGDKYEDYPEDEAEAEQLSAQKVLTIATDCKDFGNKAFKAGDFNTALDKYRKGLRYLNEEPKTDDEPPETPAKLRALRAALNSNAALMSIKLGAWDDAIHAATAAIDVEGVPDKDRAKALYRRGLARVRARDEDAARADLEAALKLAPEDAAVKTELAAVKKAAAARLAKEKAAYKKFFD